MWKWFILIRPHPSLAYLFRSKQESVQNKCYILSNFSRLKMGFHANIRVIVVNSTLQHTFPTNKRSAIKRIIELRIRTFHFFVHLPELKTMFAVYDCVVILSLFFLRICLSTNFGVLFDVSFLVVCCRFSSVLYQHRHFGTSFCLFPTFETTTFQPFQFIFVSHKTKRNSIRCETFLGKKNEEKRKKKKNA